MNQNRPVDPGKQQIIDDLVRDLPSDTGTEVDLPSECRVYELEDPAMPVTIRPMSFEDEKSIVSAKEGADPLNMILQRCVSNVKVPDLLAMDKFYLIMKLREISYGDDYNTLLICDNCKSENPTAIMLSQLNVNPVPDDFEDPITLTLPVLGKEVSVRYPRVRDEKYVPDVNTALDQLWRFIVSIDGHTDKSIIAAVLEKLPVRDTRTILNALKSDYGVDTKIKFECKDCGGVSVVDLPINANFFDVS